jgi:hypothetical protein
MYSIEKLNREGIRQWEWISNQFQNSSILLGNGFSINFSDTLRYRNLYDFFITDCSQTVKALFQNFHTRNFEKVLECIEIAEIVCDSIPIDKQNLLDFQGEVRQGLIDSINTIHPRPIDVNYDKVSTIAKQFKDFNQVFTTNYDLFLYYIILESHKFGDHMFNNHNSKFNRFGDPDQMKSNHIYFLHGALFLFESGLTTLKIKRPNNGWLLDSITNEIEKDNYPLFISEGKSETKVKAIQSNRYLSFCLDRFKNCSDKTLIVFGQSLSEQDSHIVEAIDNGFDKVAISIRPEDWPTFGHLKAEKSRIKSLFNKTETELYDSKTLFKF